MMRVCENCGQMIRDGDACEQCAELNRVIDAKAQMKEPDKSSQYEAGCGGSILGFVILYYIFRIYDEWRAKKSVLETNRHIVPIMAAI